METLSKWSNSINAFWCGVNGLELVAWKGSHQILVFDPDDYPNPPASIIQGDRRIESEEDFDYVIENGQDYEVNYIKVSESNEEKLD